ncbi:unnamed protein product [Amoebophrya sp. A120]|nr:unnamed protein product [Amoebophrya sp. A120]|eukprot:GSA120T00018505001.1
MTDRVKWDEHTIAEHDKDRGTRMKIDEPKTPYHAPPQGRSSSSSSMTTSHAPLQTDQLAAKLNALSLEQTEEEKKKQDFLDARKKHYNEGMKIKEMMARGMMQDEEESDDDEDMSEGEIERQRVLEENKRKNAQMTQNVVLTPRGGNRAPTTPPNKAASGPTGK